MINYSHMHKYISYHCHPTSCQKNGCCPFGSLFLGPLLAFPPGLSTSSLGIFYSPLSDVCFPDSSSYATLLYSSPGVLSCWSSCSSSLSRFWALLAYPFWLHSSSLDQHSMLGSRQPYSFFSTRDTSFLIKSGTLGLCTTSNLGRR